MKETIFDLVETEIPEGKEGYFEIAKRAPELKEESFFNDVKDYAKTIAKGTAEGLVSFGRMMGPLRANPEEEEYSPEKVTEGLDELLPTDEGYTQKSIRRGLGQAPSALAFPGSQLSTLPRSIAAGFLGEGAKELGAPEWAQTAAEITAYIGPDLTKKLLAKGSNQELIEAARSLGMSDEAIAPLLQSDFKTKWLAKLSPRRGPIEKILKNSKGALSDAYSTLAQSESALGEITPEINQSLMKSFGETLFDMPANVRNLVQEDFKDLISRPITGQSLMNFYADVNHNLGDKTKQLSRLKEPIKNALKSISPELGKDFEMINHLYSRYHKISGALKPNLMTDIIGASEAIGALFGMTTGNYALLTKIAGEHTARKIAQELLTNPRYQQIAEKTMQAVKTHKYGSILKLSQLYSDEIRETSPEMADQLDNLTGKELLDFFKHHESKEIEENQ